MAHQVETMMYAGQVPWHGLGKRIPADVPAAEAIVCSGLNWTVRKQSVYLGDGQEAKDYRAIVRESDNRILSIQSCTYECFQNAEMFDFAEALVGTKRAFFHTAGSLDGGRRVWALMKADGGMKVGPDEIERYLLLATSHDGSLAFLGAFTGVRVVCANTLSLAIRSVQDKVTVRHTGKLQDRIEEARKVLGLADTYAEKFGTVAKEMLKTRYSDKQMTELSETLFPVRDQKKASKGQIPTRTLNNRNNVVRLFTEGKGHTRIAGTAWAAYNAVAEFTDHNSVNRTTTRMSAQENRLNSIWFGPVVNLKQKAAVKIAEQTGLKLAA